MQINDTAHLTYCTNIHPGQNWETTFNSLKHHVPLIKAQVSNNAAFGLGLRLSNRASAELGLEKNLSEFQKWLLHHNIYVFTINGFPYGNFHDQRVKDQVHAPDWTTSARLVYTKRLFDQLAMLLPENMEGGISTSPISYKHWHTTKAATEKAFTEGAQNLAQIILHLFSLEAKTGKYLHSDIEPEPDGMLENSDEVLRFFSEYLLPIAKPILINTLGVTEASAIELVYRYITVCYDICHFSLAFEEPEDTFAKFSKAGIKIGKIQVSAALKILPEATEESAAKNDANENSTIKTNICENRAQGSRKNGSRARGSRAQGGSAEGGDKEGSSAIWEALAHFDEPTYLHQVTQKLDGRVKTYNDLPIILKNKPPFKELRAHFHVPIFLERFGVLHSTQDHILKVIAYLKRHPVTAHLEIETYTWGVLPERLKKDLSESIVREIKWYLDKL